MKKLKNLTFVVLAALAVTACEKQTTVEEKTPPKEQTTQPKEQVPKDKETAQIKVENAVADPVREEYLSFNDLKMKYEEELAKFSGKLNELSQGKLDKTQAKAIIEELHQYAEKMLTDLKSLNLKTDEVKVLRDKTVDTLSQTNSILIDSLNLTLKDVAVKDTTKLLEDMNQRSDKLKNTAMDLEKYDESLRQKIQLKR